MCSSDLSGFGDSGGLSFHALAVKLMLELEAEPTEAALCSKVSSGWNSPESEDEKPMKRAVRRLQGDSEGERRGGKIGEGSSFRCSSI